MNFFITHIKYLPTDTDGLTTQPYRNTNAVVTGYSDMLR